jgi:ribosome-binding protein aMBF1 (putative translation factor)
MSEVITRESIEARLSELRPQVEEIARLERILEVWDAPRNERRRSTTAMANRSSTRARRGSRPQEFLEAVTDSPGISAADLATEMECNVNYVYRIASDLIDEGKVAKHGKGFYPADNAPEEPEASADDHDEDFDSDEESDEDE